jgi:hypothetical protein
MKEIEPDIAGSSKDDRRLRGVEMAPGETNDVISYVPVKEPRKIKKFSLLGRFLVPSPTRCRLPFARPPSSGD